ncbi:MAG: hypothetical protein ABIS03_14830 [Gemmatimonadaceae bacterium]
MTEAHAKIEPIGIGAQWWRSREFTIALTLVLVALLIRGAVIFHPGHQPDVRIFEGWAERGARYGIINMYNTSLPGRIADYPPSILYLYTAVGNVVEALQGDFHHAELFIAILKMPAIIGDILMGLLLFGLGAHAVGPRRGLAAAGLYLLLPASWIDSAVWAQADSIYTLLLVAAFAAIAMRRGVLAGVAAGLALTAKFQVLPFLPLLAVIAVAIDWKLLVRGVVGCIAGIVLVFLPFIRARNLDQVYNAYGQAVGAYGILSVNAFNIWRIAFGDRAAAVSDLTLSGGLSLRTWSLAAFAIALALTLYFSARAVRARESRGQQQVEGVLASAAVMALVFFVFPTEIHERYLFPFIALAAIWGTRGRLELLVYCVISLSVGLNIAYSLSISVTDMFFAVIPSAERLVSVLIVAGGFAATVMIFSQERRPRKRSG